MEIAGVILTYINVVVVVVIAGKLEIRIA